MPRPPFDPRRAAGGDDDLFSSLPPASPPETPPERPSESPPEIRPGPVRGEEPPPLTVGKLSELISGALATLPARLRVIGEASNVTVNKHLYFSLKDEEALISCTMWASSLRSLPEVPRDGDLIEVRGQVAHWAKGGRTQLQVHGIVPVGLGSLERQLRARVEALRRRGYFLDEHKQPIPRVPRRIAIITGAGSAALADCLRTARDRLPAVGVVVVPVKVQGDGAAGEVARAIRAVDAAAERIGIDAICVTRGGGSLEDLWAFNEEEVADATFHCRTPIVAAIGHESDVSIIELVADLRASTPTQAITRLVPDRADLAKRLASAARSLRRGVRSEIDDARARLRLVTQHEFLRRPADRLGEARRRLGEDRRRLVQALRARVRDARVEVEHRAATLRQLLRMAVPEREEVLARRRRLARAMARRIETAGSRTRSGAGRLRGVGPAEVLSRGYAIVSDDAGRIVRSIEGVAGGVRISVAVADGTLAARVESMRGGDPLAGSG